MGIMAGSAQAIDLALSLMIQGPPPLQVAAGNVRTAHPVGKAA
jgi:hypothetical protein